MRCYYNEIIINNNDLIENVLIAIKQKMLATDLNTKLNLCSKCVIIKSNLPQN